jgi:hypothetical protein
MAMCSSRYGILARVREVLPTEFEATARDAAGHGSEIIGPLMLIARDSPDPLSQLCATKAIAHSPEPLAREALRRVCALPVENRHPSVRTVFSWPRERIVRDCTARLLWRAPEHRDAGTWWKVELELTARDALGTDYVSVREEPWDEAEFADGYYREMADLTRQFGDPEWEL